MVVDSKCLGKMLLCSQKPVPSRSLPVSGGQPGNAITKGHMDLELLGSS
jgi:hypothetical protein